MFKCLNGKTRLGYNRPLHHNQNGFKNVCYNLNWICRIGRARAMGVVSVSGGFRPEQPEHVLQSEIHSDKFLSYIISITNNSICSGS